MAQNQLNDAFHTPEVRRMTLSYLIGSVSAIIAAKLGIDPVDALCRFFESQTCANLHDERTGFYLYSAGCIADYFFEEASQRDASSGL